jgi:chaperone required for assembly of F1-ATPase
MNEPASKRPYKQAAAAFTGGVHTVLIDGRQMRTPGRNSFLLPSSALAERCAAEWAAQGDRVRPDTMPITRTVNVAIDQTPLKRLHIIEGIAGYAATDLLCHRADAPDALVRRQAEAWDPLIEWARGVLGAPLTVVTGVVPADQPMQAREVFAREAEALDDFALTGLAHAVGASGSGVIGFAMLRRRLTGVDAFNAAMLDDLWQVETWGEDFAARERLDEMQREFAALDTYFSALD